MKYPCKNPGITVFYVFPKCLIIRDRPSVHPSVRLFVCLFVCLCVLSWLNRLTFDLDF